jgi:hypothetical protein
MTAPTKRDYSATAAVFQQLADKQDQAAKLPGMPYSVSMTRTSMKLPKDLSSDQWTEIGRKLVATTQSMQWWWGDWWAYGEHRYGERQAIVETDDWAGPSFQSLADMAWVCRQVKTSRRREVLSFSHHREVAGLSAEAADQLLTWCEETIAETGKPRSTRALRGRVIAQQPVTLSPAMVERAPLAVRPTTPVPGRETSPPEPITSPPAAPATTRQQTNDSDDGADKYSWPCIPKNLKVAKLNKDQDKIIELLLKHFKDRRSQRILIMMLEGEWEWMPTPTPSADRVAIAKAALDALSFDPQALVLFAHWFTTLSQAQKNEVYQAVLLHSDQVGWLIDKLHD